jgi:hypothetical protein
LKLPEFNETIQKMARQMQNMGVIDRTITETLDSLEDFEDEELVDTEVGKVLDELAIDIGWKKINFHHVLDFL